MMWTCFALWVLLWWSEWLITATLVQNQLNSKAFQLYLHKLDPWFLHPWIHLQDVNLEFWPNKNRNGHSELLELVTFCYRELIFWVHKPPHVTLFTLNYQLSIFHILNTRIEWNLCIGRPWHFTTCTRWLLFFLHRMFNKPTKWLNNWAYDQVQVDQVQFIVAVAHPSHYFVYNLPLLPCRGATSVFPKQVYLSVRTVKCDRMMHSERLCGEYPSTPRLVGSQHIQLSKATNVSSTKTCYAFTSRSFAPSNREINSSYTGIST